MWEIGEWSRKERDANMLRHRGGEERYRPGSGSKVQRRKAKGNKKDMDDQDGDEEMSKRQRLGVFVGTI